MGWWNTHAHTYPHTQTQLPRQDETDVAVTWEDQKMINEFSWLNTRMHELKDEREELQEEVNKLDDASTELMLGSFDTPARYERSPYSPDSSRTDVRVTAPCVGAM